MSKQDKPLPAGLRWREGSPFLWYRFSYKGVRYEGSTEETQVNRAEIVRADKICEAREEKLNPLFKKAPTLEKFSEQFLEWVNNSPRIKTKTRKYYLNGWRLLQDQRIVKLPLDKIESDSADSLEISGSNSNINNALRTLRRMLGYAKEKKILRHLPEIELYEEEGRLLLVEPWQEDLLLELAPARLRVVIITGLDCGMRPDEIARMQWGHINWSEGTVLVERGKSLKARRLLKMSDRMKAELTAWKPQELGTYVFPSDGGKSGKKSKAGHVLSGSFDKAWTLLKGKANEAAKKRRFPPIPDDLVLYSTRHTYATQYLRNGGDIGTLMRLMGHASITTTQKYLHLAGIAEAAEPINKHNSAKRKLAVMEKRA